MRMSSRSTERSGAKVQAQTYKPNPASSRTVNEIISALQTMNRTLEEQLRSSRDKKHMQNPTLPTVTSNGVCPSSPRSKINSAYPETCETSVIYKVAEEAVRKFQIADASCGDAGLDQTGAQIEAEVEEIDTTMAVVAVPPLKRSGELDTVATFAIAFGLGVTAGLVAAETFRLSTSGNSKRCMRGFARKERNVDDLCHGGESGVSTTRELLRMGSTTLEMMSDHEIGSGPNVQESTSVADTLRMLRHVRPVVDSRRFLHNIFGNDCPRIIESAVNIAGCVQNVTQSTRDGNVGRVNISMAVDQFRNRAHASALAIARLCDPKAMNQGDIRDGR